MLSTLGSLLDRVQGVLSKAFLLVGFLPAAVFLNVNLLLAAWVFPSVRVWLAESFSFESADSAPYWIEAFVVTCLLALVFWSLNPWIRQFLEGRYLSDGLRKMMMSGEQVDLKKLRKQISDIVPDLVGYGKARRTTPQGRPDPQSWRSLLRAARIAPAVPPPGSGERIAILESQCQKLRALEEQTEPIPFRKLDAFFRQLESELRRTDPAEISKGPLDRLQQACIALVTYAGDFYESIETRLRAEISMRFPEDSRFLGPTRMANLAQVHREYGLNRYGLDIEVFWLRLLKVVKADEAFYPLLEEAKLQLDLSVAATAVIALTTAVWLVLGVFAVSVFPLLLTAALGPLTVAMVHTVVLQNYRAFSEAVRSAVDLHRLELLKTLHIKLPPDSLAERLLWDRLMHWDKESEKVPISLYHDEAAGGAPGPSPDDELRAGLRRLLGL